MPTLANSEDPDEMSQKCSITSESVLFLRFKYVQGYKTKKYFGNSDM